MTDYRKIAEKMAGPGHEQLVRAIAEYQHANESMHMHESVERREPCPYCWMRAGRAMQIVGDHLAAERERFDGVLVRALTLPAWGDVEDDLVKTYRDVNASDYESLQAVYGEVLEMLALNLVTARAALAGDE
ncbi:hypothetical protein ACBJ59_12275 [Nonomuraea sp. MTCD27]|uniref:hypothetical protein n=1 Tax=Nonomuraea sp. MTCD27 TaxID=1676747 RepID=UPI0035C06D1C